jgi:hypothetical protein
MIGMGLRMEEKYFNRVTEMRLEGSDAQLVICGIKKCAWTFFYVTSVGTAWLYPMLAVPKLVFWLCGVF